MPVYEVVLNGEGAFGDMLTVLHYDLVAGSAPPDWIATANVVWNHLDTTLKPALMPQIVYSGITVREDIPGSVGLNVPFPNGNVIGTNSGGEFMSQAVMLVRKNTVTLQNPSQGRIYQGGISTASLNATGTWKVDARTVVQTFWTDMLELNIAGPATLQMVIKASKPGNPNTVPYNPVANVSVESNPATQRRRRISSGS